MTSAARWVLSSTKPPTRSAGRIMSIANPQTTMSFTPMDRDLIRDSGLDCNIEKSFTELPPYRRLLCIVKYMIGEVLVYVTTQVSAIYSKKCTSSHVQLVLLMRFPGSSAAGSHRSRLSD